MVAVEAEAVELLGEVELEEVVAVDGTAGFILWLHPHAQPSLQRAQG
jgi:hypothetical protein